METCLIGSGVGRGMGVLDGGRDRRREGAVLEVNVRHLIINQRGLCGLVVFCREGWRVATRLFPNYIGISC